MGKFDQLRVYIAPTIFVLALIVFMTLLWAIMVLLFPNLLPELNGLSALPAISISAGVLIAIVTFLGDRERSSSKIFLERAIVGFDEVVKLLSNQNNNRITWIDAARTLIQTLELGDQIKNPEYKKAFDLEAEITRAKLYRALSFGDVGEPLPPNFFYGSQFWQEHSQRKILLEEAAKTASYNKTVAHEFSNDSLSPKIASTDLWEPSVIAIYDFLKFDENYSDPLDSIETPNSRWNTHPLYALRFEEGARKYVTHKKDHYLDEEGNLVNRKAQDSKS